VRVPLPPVWLLKRYEEPHVDWLVVIEKRDCLVSLKNVRNKKNEMSWKSFETERNEVLQQLGCKPNSELRAV